MAGKKRRKGKKTHKRPRRPYRQPNWRGIDFVSRASLEGDPRFAHEDSCYDEGLYFYCTPGELALARLLIAHGVRFTPDVTLPIPPKGGGKKSRSYVPDFVFNGDEYVWTDEDGAEHVIHGIECKGAMRKWAKAQDLFRHRGINIIVVSDAEIDLCERRGQLPLRPRK